jgi:hypothetical protein
MARKSWKIALSGIAQGLDSMRSCVCRCLIGETHPFDGLGNLADKVSNSRCSVKHPAQIGGA